MPTFVNPLFSGINPNNAALPLGFTLSIPGGTILSTPQLALISATVAGESMPV
ncbi:hypothetical protein [Synechococcus sp. GFB01]|uniref:hypothetical protein n=1 Tax=Synechococcus sp. GFB01 TaxID=1662190 RepID=UPI000A61B964|nr:hypothetical protein [Synechococcus sp. GFB01]